MNSIRDLVGAECGGANPLMKLTGQIGRDQARLQEGFGAAYLPGKPSNQDEQLIDDFIREQGNRQVVPQSFGMAGLLQEMREIDEAAYHKTAPTRAPAVAELASQDSWAREFLSHERQNQTGDFDAIVSLTDPNTQLHSALPHMMDPALLQHHPMMQQRHWEMQRPVLSKEQAEQWSKHYEGDDSELMKTAQEFDQKVTDPKLKNSQVEDWVSQFQMEKAHSETSEKSLTEKWAEELSASLNKPADSDYWNLLEQQWETMAKDGNHPWLDFEESELYKVYKFEEDNQLINHEDPFSEGLKRLTHGDIPNAVLLFEAAVQKNPEHTQAWQYLGTSQAENEQEPRAIAALKKCLELEPSNLTALLSLAVSYTNESMQGHACNTLIEWLRQNSKYSHIIEPEINQPDHISSSFMSGDLHDKTKRYLFTAVQSSKDRIDADIQCCLGVLFNLSSEYDKAVDCFRAALQVNPQDSLLWNRLGATLANGNRCEEAVDAYRHALSLAPGFIRCRYNLGIACNNLSAHSEAVEHFLQALNMQKRGDAAKNPTIMSDTIWSTLRMTLSLMDRGDLYKHCDHKQLDELMSIFNVSSHG